jgi:hypothetical protein
MDLFISLSVYPPQAAHVMKFGSQMQPTSVTRLPTPGLYESPFSLILSLKCQAFHIALVCKISAIVIVTYVDQWHFTLSFLIQY